MYAPDAVERSLQRMQSAGGQYEKTASAASNPIADAQAIARDILGYLNKTAEPGMDPAMVDPAAVGVDPAAAADPAAAVADAAGAVVDAAGQVGAAAEQAQAAAAQAQAAGQAAAAVAGDPAAAAAAATAVGDPAAAAVAGGEPQLTPEEEEELAQVMAQAAYQYMLVKEAGTMNQEAQLLKLAEIGAQAVLAEKQAAEGGMSDQEVDQILKLAEIGAQAVLAEKQAAEGGVSDQEAQLLKLAELGAQTVLAEKQAQPALPAGPGRIRQLLDYLAARPKTTAAMGLGAAGLGAGLGYGAYRALGGDDEALAEEAAAQELAAYAEIGAQAVLAEKQAAALNEKQAFGFPGRGLGNRMMGGLKDRLLNAAMNREAGSRAQRMLANMANHPKTTAAGLGALGLGAGAGIGYGINNMLSNDDVDDLEPVAAALLQQGMDKTAAPSALQQLLGR